MDDGSQEQPSGRALSRQALLVGATNAERGSAGMGRSGREHVSGLAREHDQGWV